MFIGKIENIKYEFARPKGAKDKKPRKKRGIGITSGMAAVGAAYGGINALGSDADSFMSKVNADPKAFKNDLDTNPRYSKQNQKIAQLNNQLDGANKIRATQEKLRLGEINEAGAKKAVKRISDRYGGKVGTPEQITRKIKGLEGSKANRAFVSSINKRRLAGLTALGAGAGALYGYGVHRARQKRKDK